MTIQECIDEQATRLTRHFAERTSRRGVLAWVGRWGLAVLGVTTFEILPIGPADVVEAASECNDRINRGMCSWPCDCRGGGQTSCPSGSNPAQGAGSFWTACCQTGGSIYLIQYQDCCYYEPSGNCCQNCCPKCASKCANGPSQPNWCGSFGGYNCVRCTMALIVA